MVKLPCLSDYGCSKTLNSPKNRISAARALTVTGMLATALLCSIFSYYTLNQSETYHRNIDRYNTVVSAGNDGLKRTVKVVQTGPKIVAKDVGYYFPDQSSWPNVAMPGFYDTVSLMNEVVLLDNSLMIAPL
jgi:hypothetical protein